MKVSPTTHSFPAKRQGWGTDEMRIDLALKAADFICDTLHCQGGMFCAGMILMGKRGTAGLWTAGYRTSGINHPASLQD